MLAVHFGGAEGDLAVSVYGIFETEDTAAHYANMVAVPRERFSHVAVAETCEWLYPDDLRSAADLGIPTYYRHEALNKIMTPRPDQKQALSTYLSTHGSDGGVPQPFRVDPSVPRPSEEAEPESWTGGRLERPPQTPVGSAL